MTSVARVILFLLSVYICTTNAQDELFRTVTGLQKLIISEKYLVEGLKKYLQDSREKLLGIEGIVTEIEDNHKVIDVDQADYLGNPINAFTLIKRFVVDWRKLKDIIGERKLEDEKSTKIQEVLDLNIVPINMTSTVAHFIKLQRLYQQETTQLAAGKLNGIQYSTEMSASDCYILGMEQYQSGDFSDALLWLIEAEVRSRKDSEKSLKNVDADELLKYKAEIYYKLGDPAMALLITMDLLEKDSRNEILLGRKLFYEGKIREEQPKIAKAEEKATTEPTVNDLYEQGCRGELKRSPSEERSLRCKYVSQNIPFLEIAPFRMEELSHDPHVVVYHDVIYDREIKTIIAKAMPDLKRSQTGDSTKSEISDTRTSHQTWLYYHMESFLGPIRQRLHDLTGLDLDFGEALQVANYGIGGHYGPHYDFSYNPESYGEHLGNRLVTGLFYINDVEQGGATAFPFLNISIFPKKGSLLFWYNLHGSLKPDYRTKHAGCPVLKGTKWILNQWIHERGHELTKPCPADSDLQKEDTLNYSYRV